MKPREVFAALFAGAFVFFLVVASIDAEVARREREHYGRTVSECLFSFNCRIQESGFLK